MEKDVAAAVIRAEEPEAFGFEVGHDGPGLFARRGFGSFTAAATGLSRTARLIADALLNQGEIGFRPVGGRFGLGWHLEVRIAFPGLFKHSFLACVQTYIPLICRRLHRGGSGLFSGGGPLFSSVWLCGFFSFVP